MYATIRSYDRFFRQAAKLQNTPAVAAVESKPETNGTFMLVNNFRSVTFTIKGDVATVSYKGGVNKAKVRTESRDMARETYRKLMAAGYKPF